MRAWCDECQKEQKDCDPDCPGRREREYFHDLLLWEMGPDFVEGEVY